MLATLGLVIVTSPYALAQQPSRPQVPQEIAALVARQNALIIRRDAAGLARLFSSDATYVTANGTAYRGRGQIQGYYVRLFEILDQTKEVIGEMARQITIDQAELFGDGAWAIGRGLNLAAGSEHAVVLTDHWVAIFVRAEGEWKIRLLSVGDDTPRRSQP
jgi:uncharacterized protein (TIGR02246 family)